MKSQVGGARTVVFVFLERAHWLYHGLRLSILEGVVLLPLPGRLGSHSTGH